ncbi:MULTISPECIES: putative porin [unclassified Dysgonomonas]|uniref:putative porin n=1 Tax=unclassified Dysgonomonas TaxID=2630389 RepID=UPI002475A724|nr:MULTISPECIES: putative porin [unclassified Dysgonomonas]
MTFFCTTKAQNQVIILDKDSTGATPQVLNLDTTAVISPVGDIGKVSPPEEQAKNARKVKPDMYGWYISSRLAEPRLAPADDTVAYNFHRATIMTGQDVAVSTLSNVGSPNQTMIFFNREEGGLFNFLNPFGYYLVTPDKKLFRNSKVPYSNLFYQTGGGGQNKEERFRPEISINFGKRLNVGFDLDYVYSRGYYNHLGSKQISYGLYASYIGTKYEMHALAYNNNFNNQENGGVVNDDNITNPEVQKFDNSRDIATRMDNAWNKLRGRQLYLTNKYNVGIGEQDSIPVASFILTSYYRDQKRRFVSTDETIVNGTSGQTATDTLYAENNYSGYPANDRMSYWSFRNTFGIALNEGFRPWVKFGLTAFIEQDIRRFKHLDPNMVFAPVGVVDNQNSTVVGGVLSKQKGDFLRYNLSADLGVLGYNVGEFRVNGELQTFFNIKGKQAHIKANAYIKNTKPTFFENIYYSKYFSWNHDFSDIRRVYIGGEIYLPQTKTRIKGGVENIKNYIYYGADKYIAQESGNIQVVSVQLDQKLNAGIFHWDNKIVYQMSSKEKSLPLPSLSVYSNIYLQSKIAKVLTLQLGLDVQYFTEYYAPGYEPALLQFYNQREKKVGNFPFANAYLNLHLKNTKFFVMLYNVGKDVGNSNYFTTLHYPVNPMILKFGLSWNFFD